MKKILLTLAILAVAAVGANAQILFEQNSGTYSAGNLVGQNSWAAQSGAGSSAVQVATSGDFILNQGSGSREDVNHGVGAISTGQTYYAGFMLNVTGGASVTDTYFAMFMNGTTNFRSRIWVTDDSGSGDFRLAFSNSNAIESTWATNLSYSTNYTIMMSFAEDTGAASLWVNPVNIGSTSISGTSLVQSPAIDAIAFRQAAGNTSQTISNLVVGTNFGTTLAAVPEPVTCALFGAGALFWVLRRKRAA